MKIDLKAVAKAVSVTAGAAVTLGAVTAASFEGIRTKAYRDAIGIPTVCLGETLHVHMGDEYTPEQCYQMFGVRIQKVADNIAKCLPTNLPTKVFAADISLAYNIGEPTFCKSSIAKLQRTRQYSQSCDNFLLYKFANKKVLFGLVTRRKAERALCLEGVNQ